MRERVSSAGLQALLYYYQYWGFFGFQGNWGKQWTLLYHKLAVVFVLALVQQELQISYRKTKRKITLRERSEPSRLGDNDNITHQSEFALQL